MFISHKLGEIRQICDELTVLRGGNVMFDGEAKGVSAEELFLNNGRERCSAREPSRYWKASP